MSSRQQRWRLRFCENTRLEEWRQSHRGNILVIGKEVITPMPSFLPTPPPIPMHLPQALTALVTQLKALPQPQTWAVREPLLSCTENTCRWPALAWVQRPKGFDRLPRAWNWAAGSHSHPGRPQLAAVDTTAAKPSVTTPWGQVLPRGGKIRPELGPRQANSSC